MLKSSNPTGQASPHKINRGDARMKEEKYAATYQYGKTTVRIVAPPPMSEEEKEKVLNEMHRVGWEIVHNLRMKGVEV